MLRQSRLILSLLLPIAQVAAQQRDTTAHTLAPTVVTAPRTHGAVTRLGDDSVGHIYTGVPTTLLTVDSLPVNLANSSWRQLFSTVPGANISETRGAGFPTDGLGFRGLSPRQSVEVSVRQNGVNLAGDLYGYPEQYYTPPFEAVDHVEVVRGASGLEYGPQFGGMVNFVLKDGSLDTPPQLAVKQTFESFGEYDAFGSIGGGTGRITYYGFARYQGAAGWRQNSNFREGDAYGALTYHFSDAVSTSLQGTLYWSRIHMPGGFDDSSFAANPQASLRARNWIATPWSILENITTWHIAPGVTLTNQLSGMLSQRYLVWRNEDGGPQAIDSIDAATGQYTTPREVEREYFANAVLESRLGARHHLVGLDANLAAGLRLFDGWMHRQEGASGTLGSDFSMQLTGPYPTDMRFGTKNAAGYLQEGLRLTDKLTVTPGARLEWLQSSINGTHDDSPVAFDKRSQTFVLGSLGVEYRVTPAVTLYGNITQAYRPITYDNLIPFGTSTTATVDPNLHHSSGYTSDFGIRGRVGPLTGDIDAFYLWYGDRIGTVAHDSVIETTNVADSRHYGIESYLDLTIVESARWRLSLFDSFAWVDAHYVSGSFSGKLVEYAPPITNRLGPTLGYRSFSTTVTWGHTAKQYGDASNVVFDVADPAAGVIPAFDVFDWSGRVEVGHRYQLQFGIDNFTNRRYFTFRTGEYPGPGIIPANGRTAFLGVSALF
jgi:Fe(3+) dicitrate transport protein